MFSFSFCFGSNIWYQELRFKMGSNNAHFTTKLLILNGKNWNRWRIQMKALLGFQEVGDIIEDGFQELPTNPTEAQMAAYKDNKRK
ncbi:hypothetical protein Lal_00033986 [Lupinus albus]|nr:hypothetical protein Lal_00033986 [Lupinus albus]